MGNSKPPFTVTNNMVTQIADIAEAVGKLSANSLQSNPVLRRTNRIRTIHGSLAIEQNTLSLEQVTALLNGKRVLAPPKDIEEVKNAYEIYERMQELNPYDVEDLLAAHYVMTRNLVDESGMFRTGSVGVVDQQGNVLHFGTLPAYVPGMVMDLLGWAKESDTHILIRSCVVHYELELIHPFADGNGRIGRLWHTLMLSKWNPIFAYLPVESMIHAHQDEYYAAINVSNNQGESTAFIEFMLATIKASLMELAEMRDEMRDAEEPKAVQRYKTIMQYLQKHEYIMNSDVQSLFEVSSATANRILGELVAENRLEKVRRAGHWAYIRK